MKLTLEKDMLIQALATAWQHVQAKASAPGLDGIDIMDFRLDANHQLRLLRDQMLDGSYTPGTVRIFTLKKGQKTREIGLLCVRDRIAQHAMAQILSAEYEPRFLPQSYAFRPSKSAKQAVQQVCQWIQEKKTSFFRSDIDAYFNHIHHEVLLTKLEADVDEALLRLISESIKLQELRDGALVRREMGLCQGSPLSPLLANVYLHDFDRAMVGCCDAYIRYCDDFVCMADDQQAWKALAAMIGAQLEPLHLTLKSSKTSQGMLSDGFAFLGYFFSDQGSVVMVKAIESLADSLTPRIERLLAQLAQQHSAEGGDVTLDWGALADVLRGWQQYYPLPTSLFVHPEIAIAVAARAIAEDDLDVWSQLDIDALQDVLIDGRYWPVFAAACMRLGMPSDAIHLFEGWFGKEGLAAYDASSAKKLYDLWARDYFAAPDGILAELVQAYTDLGVFSFAHSLYDQSSITYEFHPDPPETATLSVPPQDEPDDPGEPTEALPARQEETFTTPSNEAYLPETMDIAQRIVELLARDKDRYGQEPIALGIDRHVQHVLEPLTAARVLEHLRGACVISTPIVDAWNQVSCVVLDVDITQKMLSNPAVDIVAKKREALAVAAALCKRAARLGLRTLLEDSGQRGYHIWMPLDTPLLLAEAVELTLLWVRGIDNPIEQGITVERLPNVKRIRAEQTPQIIKLPGGRHPITGERCRFVEDDGSPVQNPVALLQSFVLNALRHVRELLLKERAENIPISTEKETISVAELIPLSPGIEAVLERCAIMRHLCACAMRTGFLVHTERLHILYVFGHMGEVGQRYIHQVMKWTYNYRYDVTQRFIERILDRPISCHRLREWYADKPFIAFCNCNFPLVKGTYPSPVLHAHAIGGGEDVAVPRNDRLAKADQENLSDAFHTHGQIRDLAQQMLTMNQEKNKLEEEIAACQQKLAALFDLLRIDSFEIGIGMLTRTKTPEGAFRWGIRIE
ncbi:MAG: hypothetical protein LBU67_01765 [Oscillospiraceae bacterium]|jgi:group II intron reverse transcriptase/maturase|nr:hypothetical protein [Oscillospiraceae bacterium]